MLMRCIRAENRKLRRSPIWLLFLAVPAISAIYGTFNYRMNQGILTHGWYDLWTQYTLFYCPVFLCTPDRCIRGLSGGGWSIGDTTGISS